VVPRHPKGEVVPKGPIPEHKLNAIAHMAANGFDVSEMSQLTQLQPDTIKRLLSNGNQKFNALKAEFERKKFASVVLHTMRLRDKQEACYRAIDNALEGTDKRLAVETAWKTLDQITPRVREPETPQEVNVNIRAQAEFTQTVLEIGKQFGELKEVLATQDPNRHVLSGRDALPRAIAAPAPEAKNVKVEVREPKDPEEDNRW
jgi:hypothetical protein